MNKGGTPDALVIGPMKAGTTWIQRYMETCEGVCLPRGVKETFFFDRYWERGAEWYRRRFVTDDPTAVRKRLEIAPSYFHKPEVPRRIKETLGNIPILVTLRNPVERAWSHYLHLRRYGYTNSSLWIASQEFPEIIDASRYRTCLQNWYAEFSRESVRFVWLELLQNSPIEYAVAVCEALNIEYREVPSHLFGESNEAALPASHKLAALGDRSAHLLRGLGLYSIVNVAKQLGLKRFFFGKPGSANQHLPTATEYAWLEEQFVNEIPQEAVAKRYAASA